MVKVQTDKHFKGMTWNEHKQKYVDRQGEGKDGFYIHSYLKDNIDKFFIGAVMAKWDGVMLITGMEGSGKSTTAFTLARYCDPTFPGEPLEDGTERRTCERIVFTSKQFHEVVNSAKPGQAIVWDEFVLGGFSGDAATTIQKEILKKLVTIRKKRLYIFLVIPTMFMLRRYFAVMRSRACLHQYTPDGISRGTFKFYSYDTKRKLYIRGIKEWDMGVVKPDFIGSSTDTQGYFFDLNEYEDKKDAATVSITEEPEKRKVKESNKRREIKEMRNDFVHYLFIQQSFGKTKYSYTDFSKWVYDNFEREITPDTLGSMVREAKDRQKKVTNNE